MPSFFHQNMWNFGGGAAARNALYFGPAGAMPPAGAFGAISGAIGGAAAPVAVAGFTEIVNNGATQAALTTACNQFGLTFRGNVACGITALARNGPEYIGLGVAAGWAIQTYGRVTFGRIGGALQLYHQRAATRAALNNLGFPQNMSADYRGLVYVVVTVPGGHGAASGQNVAIGFLHNMYTFLASRTLVALSLPAMAALMGAAFGGLAAVAPAPVLRCIGGDFNVLPIPTRGAPPSQVWSRDLGLAAVPAGATAGGTTWHGSLYDYWYTTIDPGAAPPGGFVLPAPATHVNTLNHTPGGPAVPAGAARMSDHCGVSLRFI